MNVEDHCGIYGIFDAETGECLYVGKSAHIEKRWWQHLAALQRNSMRALDDFRAWFHAHDCNPKTLHFEILEECENNRQVFKTLEIKWFNILHPKFFGQEPNEHSEWILTATSRQTIAASMRTHYATLPGSTYVGDKYVIGLKPRTQYTQKKILEGTCSQCGETFYYTEKVGKRTRCATCSGRRQPLETRLSTSHLANADVMNTRLQSDTGIELTKEQFEHEYFDLQKSTCEIAEEYHTSDVLLLFRVREWGITLRSRSEALHIAAKKKRQQCFAKIDDMQFQLLWNLGVSRPVIQHVVGVGKSLLNQYIAENDYSRTDIRTKAAYPVLSDEVLVARLQAVNLSGGDIALVIADLARLRHA